MDRFLDQRDPRKFIGGYLNKDTRSWRVFVVLCFDVEKN